jgi:hypothetical protein
VVVACRTAARVCYGVAIFRSRRILDDGSRTPKGKTIDRHYCPRLLPTLLLGIGVVLLLGALLGRYSPEDRTPFTFVGICVWVVGVLGGIKLSVQDRNLKEDLAKSPNNVLRDDNTDEDSNRYHPI